jgi:L-2-amino-thiazoline-4-carboxylic acid hydrolase
MRDYTDCFERELRRRYPASATVLWPEIAERYQRIAPEVAFARRSSNPVDRRLDFCAFFLATIQALEKRGAGFDEIRETCLAITEDYVRPKTAWQRWLKPLPVKLMRTPLRHLITRLMQKKAGRRGHPDGFLVQIVTTARETHGLGFGFDILECGICKLFDRHGARRYVPILCSVDELTSAMAGLELVRSGTLGLGAAKCDFRFRLLGRKSLT